MTDAPESLVFDLVEWVAKEPRTYAKMLDAWRTSCPRLTVWEDAIEHSPRDVQAGRRAGDDGGRHRG